MPNTALFPSRANTVAIWMQVVDGFPDAEHSARTTIGGAPLEDGAYISDHAFLEPMTLKLTGWISGSPAGQAQDAATRVNEAWQAILKARKSLEPIAVVTPLHFYPEMLIEQARAPHNQPGLQVELDLREVQRARVVEEVIEPPAPGGVGGSTSRVSAILNNETEIRMLQPGDPHSAYAFTLPFDFEARALDHYTGGEPMFPGDPYHFSEDEWSEDIDPYLRTLLAKKLPRQVLPFNSDYDIPPPAVADRTITGPSSDAGYDVPPSARLDRTITGPSSTSDYDVGPSERFDRNRRGRTSAAEREAANRSAQLARERAKTTVGNVISEVVGAVTEGFGIGQPNYNGTGKATPSRAIDDPFSYNGLMPDLGGRASANRRLPSRN